MKINDRISKQRLNIILLVDASTSMQGTRIDQVNRAIIDVRDYLRELQAENINVDFYITIITFSTNAFFKNNEKMSAVNDFEFESIKAGGWSNLHLAYQSLDSILQKESQGGIMPDFGGVAPIILLFTDGHPTAKCKGALVGLNNRPWFKADLRYGIAVELNDQKTCHVLQDFVGNNGDVIDCYDARLLEKIIKIIALTASKVKSQSSSFVSAHNTTKQAFIQTVQIQ